ncbi:MAG: PEP-CTERM sorting domain-containing protein [Alphaproteobacteria bacterium]|nr:PEP-CTERM sorting domain-containing protein [Alphaproteobacteria bacterium]
MFIKKIISVLFISLWLVSATSIANATVISYNNRVTFEATLTNILTDDFNSPAYSIVNSAISMKNLSAGSIGYESTFFSAPDLNIVSTQQLCWGCNGTGQIILDGTTIGSNVGIFGFGLDITSNNFSSSYTAFVTYGDGSTQNFGLGLGGTFFGLTSTSLIKQVHFGLPNGGAKNNGSFRVDNVTIGNSMNEVPEPAPMALLGLGLLGLLAVRKRHQS